MAISGSAAPMRMLVSITALVLTLHMRSTSAEPCVLVAGFDQRYQHEILKCTLSTSSQYASIPNDTVALWIIYPEGNTVRDTFAHAHPFMPNLEILVIDVTFLNETDFEPGAFVNSDMPRLETIIIERDLNAPQTQNTGYLLLDDTFLGLSSLKNLYLESLGMIELEVDSLRGLDNLERLSLKQNYLTYILPNSFMHTPNLTFLSLHDNYIENLHNDALAGLGNLTRLDFSLNSFTEFKSGPFLHLENLETFDLSNNQVGSIETGTFGGQSKLHYLALNSNELFEVSMDLFDDLASLESLILDSNEIQLRPNLFSPLTNLRHLSMSNNELIRIEATHFNGLISLGDLYLSNNLLDTIHNDTFAGLTNLIALDLDENLIATVESNAFRGLDNLAKFSIEGNSLTSLTETVFAPFLLLDTIYLHENAWVCNCDIQWLIVWIRERYDTLEPRAQWNYIFCGANDVIPSESFYTLIHEEQYLNDVCGPYYVTTSTISSLIIETTPISIETTPISTINPTSPIIAQVTTAETAIYSSPSPVGTTRGTSGDDKNGDKDDDDGLFASDDLSSTDIVIVVFLLLAALVVVIVIVVCLLHRKKRKNRMWLPPEGKANEKRGSELVNQAQTPVPSFYPDPDQTDGGATWEHADQDGGDTDTSETTHDTSALTPAAPNGGLKIQHAYLNQALATDSNESLSTAFRDRKPSMQSADSVYTYEGEYYRDGYDRQSGLAGEHARISAVSMTPSGTPRRVRTVSASSLDRKRHHSDGGVASNDRHLNGATADLQVHSLGGAGVHYADIRMVNGGHNNSGNGHHDDTNTRYHAYQSTSAESDDAMLPAQNVLYSQGANKHIYAPLRTDTSPENSASSAIELKPLATGTNSQARPLKVKDLKYVEVEKDLNSPTYNETSANSDSFFAGNTSNIHSDSPQSGKASAITVKAVPEVKGAGHGVNGAGHGVMDTDDVNITMDTDHDGQRSIIDVAL